MDTSASMIKPENKGYREIFCKYFYRPIANVILDRFFKHVDISPNTITVISLLIGIVAAVFFLLPGYWSLVLAVFFLQVTLIFDVLDGQYARYKGKGSDLGRVFDSVMDMIKIVIFFFAMSYGVFLKTGDHWPFVAALFATANSMLTCYMIVMKRNVLKIDEFTVTLSKKIYVSYEVALYLLISLFALLDKVYLGLVFLATLGSFGWIKIFAGFFKKGKAE